MDLEWINDIKQYDMRGKTEDVGYAQWHALVI
jgi:hypothetical protein